MLNNLPQHAIVLHQSMTVDMATDGLPAKLITLVNQNGMSVTLMDIGATWLSCCVPVAVDHQTVYREVLLGVSTLNDFYQQQAYLGATVGRYANRIAAGKFNVDGENYQVSTNQNGNCLHGGETGFDKRRWHMQQLNATEVQFKLLSADGDMGFPGNLQVVVTYTLTENNELTIRYSAETDKPTIVNLTNHGYFNLLGVDSGHDCLSHQLTINADHYLPTDQRGIPCGDFNAVEATSFDFRQPKAIHQDWLIDADQQQAKGYDHSFVLHPDVCRATTACATVIAADGSLTMDVLTTKPAMQLYTGNYLAGCPNRIGGEYADHSGFALETQFLPDSPNHPEWQDNDPILRPNEHYHYLTSYRFR
ncbi:galactose-1-epimerase [Photobacterium phosphoreum]|uniref:Aldose 1-epimerase n=1 Tax=Photobacterium phosphoreum TaxID=659 RepID=A0AAW4ZYK6_PHOPO|nr:galactose-1-epimerase [Photobacterium phosphoreum]MCD9491908.1 galactose-1-epimerase [Photobacterium phosphoreum]MCF2191951.1 galactose-1-epimerase [Photobacterium phosphoreum]MCF2303593.1 galactose-1-epimerase [Photobacterium phosphoreum]